MSKRRRRPCRFGYGGVELCVCRCGRVQSIHVHAWRKQMELSRSQPDAAVVRSVGRLTYVQVLAGLRAVGCVMEPITPQPPGQVAVHAVQPHRILPRRRRRRILRHDQNRDRHRRLARPRHRAATSRTGSRSTTSGACTPPSAIKPQPRLAVPGRNAWQWPYRPKVRRKARGLQPGAAGPGCSHPPTTNSTTTTRLSALTNLLHSYP